MRRVAMAGLAALVLLGTAGCARMQEWTGMGDEAARPVDRDQTRELSQVPPVQMLGMDVIGYDGRSAGEVEDVLLGRDGNRAERIVVETGGMLGIGGREVALDAANVRFAPDRNALVATQLTAEQVAGMPEYQGERGLVSLNRARRTQ